MIFSFLSKNKKINYKGFELCYSRGTTIVDRFKKDGDYEPKVVDCICRWLDGCTDPKLLDIGANIGMIALAVLSKVSKVKIYAFEPGPHQYELLKETILQNNLSDKIFPINVALSNFSGSSKFAIHVQKHASGDGFFDTKRGGKVKEINVNVETLDNWWNQNLCPKINFVKIDTEGSELWIFEGGRKFIEACKPVILLEIHPMNIKPYPYNVSDIYQFFIDVNYRITTLEGEELNIHNLEILVHNRQENFLAIPNKL